MNIRTRITLLFCVLVITIVSGVSASVYYLSSTYQKVDFERRLRNRAVNTAKLLVEFEEVDANLLRRIEKDNPASLPDQFVTIFNFKNEILYSSDIKGIVPFDEKLLDRIRLEEEIDYSLDDYQIVGMLLAERYDRFTVIAGAHDVNGLDALHNLRNILLTTFAISVVLVTILGWFYAGKVLRPILRIVQDVDLITEASLDQRLQEGNTNDEIGKLAHTFNGMLSRLEHAFVSQKTFIANASHELKTPFTVMAGEIEVTLLKPRDNDYYVKVLHSVLGNIKQLNKLSTQLLLLAQTSSDHPEKKLAPVRIDDVIWDAKEEMLALHHDYKIEIVFDANIIHEVLLINGDEQLIKVLIMNLIDNGCKYSDNRHVDVTLISTSKEQITMQFNNNGKGIAEENLKDIFAPFYRGTHDKKMSGSGIGLSLAARIVDLHGGTIHVTSVPDIRTSFIVNFPLLKSGARKI